MSASMTPENLRRKRALEGGDLVSQRLSPNCCLMRLSWRTARVVDVLADPTSTSESDWNKNFGLFDQFITSRRPLVTGVGTPQTR